MVFIKNLKKLKEKTSMERLIEKDHNRSGKKISEKTKYKLKHWQLTSKRDRSICQICKNPSDIHNGQTGFKIPDNDKNIRQYGHDIIYSYHNQVCVCCLGCAKKVNLKLRKDMDNLAIFIACLLKKENKIENGIGKYLQNKLNKVNTYNF